MAAILPNISKLNTLVFSLGIRAEDINDNFDLLRYWIEAERLRMGGWGLVEGFDLTRTITTYDQALGDRYWDASIHVSPGLLINEHGQEIQVAEKTFPAAPPRYTPVTETVTADSNGVIKLSYPAYSNEYHRIVYYVAGQGSPRVADEELKITVTETGEAVKILRDIEFIAETDIKLTARWANKKYTVSYYYAADRIDAIMLKKDGSQYMDPMPMGIISTSPSQQVVQEYFENGWYLIGFAYWHVGQEIDVEFFTGDRTLRSVFVDKNNVLYLNGKPYREKTVVYFEEPDPPQENDLWYDTVTEILYIWRPNKDGKFEWQPVNDLSRSVTSAYTFPAEENPEDLRTFDFNTVPELFFMPGQHQVTVIIDQVVIMEDQYEELYYGQDEVARLLAQNEEEGNLLYAQLKRHLCGYGIRLLYPLERPSLVEVRVTHNVNNKGNDTDLFQHESLFLMSGNITVTNASTRIYPTNCEFESGNAQLEVYKNGIRLVCGKQYVEVTKSGSDASESGILCNRFRLLQAPAVNDVLDYRVLRSVSSYANLKAIIREYEEQVEECQEHVDSAIEIFEAKAEDFAETKTAYGQRITAAEQNIAALTTGKMDANKVIGISDITADMRQKMVAGRIDLERETNANDIFLENVSPNDYVTIAYARNADTSPVLLSEARNDYSLVATEGGSNLELNNRWLSSATAKVYITGLRLGV